MHVSTAAGPNKNVPAGVDRVESVPLAAALIAAASWGLAAVTVSPLGSVTVVGRLDDQIVADRQLHVPGVREDQIARPDL